MVKAKGKTYYGVLTVVVSSLCNAALFAAKLAAGLIFSNLAAVADAFNNLTDMGNNIVSLVGIKAAKLPADKEHPFGHARAEYLAALIVAFSVFFLGLELIISAVEKIITPTPTQFSFITVAILSVSVLVKLFMYFLNRINAKKTKSAVLKAAAADSLADVIASATIIVSMLISRYARVELDAYMTIAVAIFILFSGYGVLKDVFSSLLGKGAEKEKAKQIKGKILSYEGVLGVHDLMVHDYGGKLYASVHVEVDANKPVLQSHELIDKIEFGFLPDISMVIHIDPVVCGNAEVDALREKVESFLKEIEQTLSMHDFRAVFASTHTNLIFDVAVPYECKLNFEEIDNALQQKILQLGSNYYLKITYDKE